jgi:aminoglycoside phosphotransferase (APT) family kinase protein
MTMVFPDTYLQPDAPDPVLAEQAIVAAARRHAPGVGGLLRVDESGGEARAYFLEGGIVIKTQRPHRLRPRTSLRKEALFLSELERQGDFPVPRALGHGEVEGTEYLCLTEINGVALEHASLPPLQRAEVLGNLGRTLRAIHDIEQSVLADSELVPGDRTSADLKTRFAGTFERLATALEADRRFAGTLDVRELAAQRLALTPDNTPPVALHSNPGPEHTFVDPTSGGFVGLIDFGDAYRSHPALDLRPWAEAEDSQALLAGYASANPLPAGFEDVWRTGRVIVELSWATRGQRDPNELGAALRRLLQ